MDAPNQASDHSYFYYMFYIDIVDTGHVGNSPIKSESLAVSSIIQEKKF